MSMLVGSVDANPNQVYVNTFCGRPANKPNSGIGNGRVMIQLTIGRDFAELDRQQAEEVVRLLTVALDRK